jgi:hypothetical protein
MPSRFEERFQRLAVPAMEREFGVIVQFSRGVYLSAPFVARRSDRIYSAIGAEYGIEVKITMRDFVLPSGSLVVDGSEIEPQTGDRIIERNEIFEISPPDDKTPSVELQPGLYEWVVHTKKIE